MSQFQLGKIESIKNDLKEIFRELIKISRSLLDDENYRRNFFEENYRRSLYGRSAKTNSNYFILKISSLSSILDSN